MSKKRPSQAEARWRANYRYRRMRTVWLNEAAIGDPLGFVAELRRAGTLACLQFAIMATAGQPHRPGFHRNLATSFGT